MNNLVSSEYDSFEKRLEVRTKGFIDTSIIHDTIGITKTSIVYVSVKIEEDPPQITLFVGYTPEGEIIDELLIKINDKELLRYKVEEQYSNSVAVALSQEELEKICNAKEVEMRIKNSKGHTDFTSADIIFGARIMYNAICDEGAYLEEIQNREKDIAEQKAKEERIELEKKLKYQKREERINIVGVNKFFIIEYDKFRQKLTIKQKEELELDSTTGPLMVLRPKIQFRYVHVSDDTPLYLFDFDVISDLGLNLKNGECIILLNDNERLILKPRENYSESYLEKYHIESNFYVITEEELVKLCNASKIEMRVTNGDGFADITTKGIQVAARRFYNAVIDDTAYTDDLLTQEEREAAESERRKQEFFAELEAKQRERDAREAEEARIRAEKRAAWWAANKKKVGITILVLISIIAAAIGITKIVKLVGDKRAISQAYEMIEQGEALIPSYKFDEAKKLYNKAFRITDDNDVHRKVQEKRKELEEASQAAESEYNNALRRLKILLDADDNEFNEISNACLDKMIEIYPDRQETIYYKNIRGK